MNTVWESTMGWDDYNDECGYIHPTSGKKHCVMVKGINGGETTFLTHAICEILNQNSENIDNMLKMYEKIGEIDGTAFENL